MMRPAELKAVYETVSDFAVSPVPISPEVPWDVNAANTLNQPYKENR